MSLTFSIACDAPSVPALLAAHPTAICLGPTPDSLTAHPTHLVIPQVTTRPVELTHDGRTAQVRLLTNGACPQTSAFGLALITTIAKAANTDITDEEGATHTLAGFAEAYGPQWCADHAAFGLTAARTALRSMPKHVALFPIHDGHLVLHADGLAAPDAEVFERLRRRAWIDAERTVHALTLGGDGTPEHRAQALHLQEGRTSWASSNLRWGTVEGVTGVVPMAELLMAFGDTLVALDDGAVALPALHGGAWAAFVERAQADAREPALLTAVPSVSAPTAGRALTDMELVPAALGLVHPDDLRTLLEDQLPKSRAGSFDAAALNTLPEQVLRDLAVAPVLASTMVAMADGGVSLREHLSIVRSARSVADPNLQALWAVAYPEDDAHWSDNLRPENTVDDLIRAIEAAGTYLTPAPRKAWCDAVMARAEATAQASGGGLLGFITGRGRVGPEEREALDTLGMALRQVRSRP